jgi:hypothetical protein
LIHLFDSGNSRGKLRIWLDELPGEVLVSGLSENREDIIPGASSVAVRQCAAVEFFRPVGGTFQYGLLGADFSSGNDKSLSIVLPRGSSTPIRRFGDSLAGRLDTAIVGSTSEYSEAVLKELRRWRPSELPSGRVHFSAVAHGAVGSAPVVFASLASVVIRLLMGSDVPKSEEEVKFLMRSAP